MKRLTRLFYHRFWIFRIIITTFCLILISRLSFLQIYLNESLLKRSEKNYLRIQQIAAPRGTILDHTGAILATNKPITDLVWQSSGNYTFTPQQEALLTQVINLCPSCTNIDKVKLQYAERMGKEYILIHELSFNDLSRIIEQFPTNPYITLKTTYERYYPHGNLGCHALGYLSGYAMDPEGKMGIEKVYQEELKGTPAIIAHAVTARGKEIEQREISQAEHGQSLTTTLDIPLMTIIEKNLPPDCSGSVIALEQDGALRALVSRPYFDPNIFLNPLDQKTWDTLQEDKPFINRACYAHYPPGSIFKLVVAAAALETGIITTNQYHYCPGYTFFAGRAYFCMHREGHGSINSLQGVAQSCNVLFYEIGKKITIDTLADYAHRFGLGESTGCPFIEKTGLVPSTMWKKKNKHEPWWPGETLSVAVGQSYTLVTPIQAARMVNAIGTGYLVRPYILQNQKPVKEPLAISATTRSFLLQAMHMVVQEGTCSPLKSVPDFDLYGKTGTAQVTNLTLREQKKHVNYTRKELCEHGWCVVFCKHPDCPPFALVVLLEHVSSSMVSVTIVKNILTEYAAYLKQHRNSLCMSLPLDNGPHSLKSSVII
jgi:penicillin-binding protein 2